MNMNACKPRKGSRKKSGEKPSVKSDSLPEWASGDGVVAEAKRSPVKIHLQITKRGFLRSESPD